MALPNSGLITMADIAAEFGGAAPHSLSEYYGVAPGVPTSGLISMADFYGTSSIRTVYTKPENLTPLQDGWSTPEGGITGGTTVWSFAGTSSVKFFFGTFASSKSGSLAVTPGKLISLTVRARKVAGPGGVVFHINGEPAGFAVPGGASLSFSSTSFETKTVTYTAPTSGQLYMAFTQIADAGSQYGSGYIDSILITEE